MVITTLDMLRVIKVVNFNMKQKYWFKNYYLGPDVPEIPSGDVELTVEEFFAIITNKKI